MRKILFAIFLIFILSSFCDAATIFTEGFENTGSPGYDETSSGAGSDWVETIGSGGAINENSASSSFAGTPVCFGDESLSIVQTAGTQTYTTNVLDSGIPIIYVRYYYEVNSESLANSETNRSFRIVTTGNSTVCTVYTQQSSGGQLRFNIWCDAEIGDYNIAVDTVYRVELKYDYTNGDYEARVDGNVVGTPYDGAPASLDHSISNEIELGSQSGLNTVANMTSYYDNVSISTSDWLGDSTCGNSRVIVY